MQRPTIASALLLLGALPAHGGDLTLTRLSRVESQGGRAMESTSTLLIHAQRSRTAVQTMVGKSDGTQVLGPHVAIVMQCDLRRMLTIDLDHKVYSVAPLHPQWNAATLTAATLAAKAQPTPTESLTVVRTIVESGEQRSGFNRLLRHYSMHEQRIPSSGANARQQEGDTSGWYVEIPEYDQLRGCDPVSGLERTSRGAVMLAGTGSQPINYRVGLRATGPAVLGYPADVTTVSREQVKERDGSTRTVTSQITQKITQLSSTPLDPALFEIPGGFARVDRVETGPSLPTLSYQVQIAWARLTQVFSR